MSAFRAPGAPSSSSHRAAHRADRPSRRRRAPLLACAAGAAIPDTDAGALDHDAVWDRAVGPAQFIPSSWRVYGADGNGDGQADPDNVFDAGLATARYLCSARGDLSSAAARHDAVFRYNHSEFYVATVLRWADAYASGVLPVPDSSGTGSGPGSDDAQVTLAALPSSSVPTAGVAAPVVGAPVITTPGATRPTSDATRSRSPALPPVPAPPGALTGAAPHPASAPTPTSTSSTATTASGTTSPTTPSSSSAPPPSTSATATPAARCTAALPLVARASGVPAAQLTAGSTPGPGAGRTTCTVRGPRGPLLVAVTSTPASSTSPTGVSRTVAGGATVLTVPTTSGLNPDRAKAVLAALAAGWA